MHARTFALQYFVTKLDLSKSSTFVYNILTVSSVRVFDVLLCSEEGVRKIAPEENCPPRSGSGFGLGLALELGLRGGGDFPRAQFS